MATGPTPTMRAAVMKRADNCCERCGQSIVNIPGSIHHRSARRMGGRKGANTLTNLVLLCGTGTTGCHGEIESYRQKAKAAGWIVSSWESPETVPLITTHGDRFLLDDDRRVDL